ncbi:MAG: aminoacyl-tRNA hydrolase [Rhodothermaceae bacterium]|nr:aminoacyl-tRNA hydrolase [Rhodothermaceae bacterium]
MRSGLLRRFWPFRARTSEEVPEVSRLIIGLGNPGPDYEDTRHNIGFEIAERVAEKAGLTAWTEAASALVAEGQWRGRPVAVAKPLTFMNRSGQAYRALLRRYTLAPDDVLVVYDDLSLPEGALRLRGQGSAGGHNGVQDIADRLNSTEFPRLRVGIGNSFPAGGQVRYVLEPFADDQRPIMDEAVEAAAEAALTFIRDDLTTAMNRHNRRG